MLLWSPNTGWRLVWIHINNLAVSWTDQWKNWFLFAALGGPTNIWNACTSEDWLSQCSCFRFWHSRFESWQGCFGSQINCLKAVFFVMNHIFKLILLGRVSGVWFCNDVVGLVSSTFGITNCAYSARWGPQIPWSGCGRWCRPCRRYGHQNWPMSMYNWVWRLLCRRSKHVFDEAAVGRSIWEGHRTAQAFHPGLAAARYSSQFTNLTASTPRPLEIDWDDIWFKCSSCNCLSLSWNIWALPLFALGGATYASS